jgi:hypothetical protein
MNLNYIQTLWEEQRLVYGISARVFHAIPKDKMDAHPIPGMRTPKELIAHMAAMMHSIPTGIVKGKIEAFEEAEKEFAAKPYDEFMKWVAQGWTVADKATKSLDEKQATAMVRMHAAAVPTIIVRYGQAQTECRRRIPRITHTGS